MRVLIGIDDSVESFHALDWILHKFFWKSHDPTPHCLDPNAETHDPPETDSDLVGDVVTLIHVMEPLPRFTSPVEHGAESVIRTQEQYGARILARANELCKEKMVKAKTLIVEGDPKNVICQMTEEMAVDLLVVGSRGLGQIKRALLGSVSDYCAQHAKCPVLIVKLPKKSHG